MGKELVLIFLFVAVVNARVYYLQNVDSDRNDAAYPVIDEQSSRDLDLSFSAGDSNDNDNVHSYKKAYAVVAPEKPQIELDRDIGRPQSFYKLVEAPPRRTGIDDVIVIPEKNRRLVKINGKNKGEVILELRVIANHDDA